MIIEVEILPIEHSNSQQYHVIVGQSSGNSDVTNNKVFTFQHSEHNEMITFLNFVDTIKYVQNGVPTTPEYILSNWPVANTRDPETVAEVCGYDSSTDNYLCIIDSIAVKYYNHSGQEFDCKLIKE